MMEMATKERLSETIAFRVTPKIYQFLNELGERERRKMSEIATALLERGIAAYHRDRELFEPATTQYKRVPQTVTAPERKTGTRNK